jgi:hypothetical protein
MPKTKRTYLSVDFKDQTVKIMLDEMVENDRKTSPDTNISVFIRGLIRAEYARRAAEVIKMTVIGAPEPVAPVETVQEPAQEPDNAVPV